MVRGIIFDCFGVLCQGSLEYFVSRAAPENRAAVIDTNRAADYGYITHAEYLTQMAESLQTPTDEIAAIIKAKHIRNEPMFELARSLKPRYKLGLLSNVGSGIISELFTPQELTQLFDTVVLSGEVGMAKPNPEIYELAAARLGLTPAECVMIDDIPVNVEGAIATGMQGIVCGSVRQVADELASVTANGQ